jgi:hypothetical protein
LPSPAPGFGPLFRGVFLLFSLIGITTLALALLCRALAKPI